MTKGDDKEPQQADRKSEKLETELVHFVRPERAKIRMMSLVLTFQGFENKNAPKINKMTFDCQALKRFINRGRSEDE